VVFINLNYELWIQYLKAKGLSNRTIKEYNYYIAKFQPLDLTQQSITLFLTNYLNPIAKAMITNLIKYVKLSEYPEEIKQQIRLIEIPKITGRKKTRLIEYLTEEEIHQLANRIRYNKHKLMIFIGFYGGLRLSEICGIYAIKPLQFNWNQWLLKPEEVGILKVIGKGNKERRVFIPSWVMILLQDYIKNDISQTQKKSEPLFIMNPRNFAHHLAKFGNKILDKKIHPHMLRHGCATWLKAQGWSLDEIKIYLGHESIATTNIYAHINQSHLMVKFQKAQINSYQNQAHNPL